jgi:hypothetical protein
MIGIGRVLMRFNQYEFHFQRQFHPLEEKTSGKIGNSITYSPHPSQGRPFMNSGKLLGLVLTLLILLLPSSHPVFSQEDPSPTPVPNAPAAESIVYLPLVTKPFPTTTYPPPNSSHPRRIDHRSVDLFSRIPAQYLTSARNLKMLFSDRSVGQNINEALDCLTATSWAESPASCRNDYIDANWNWKTFTQIDLNSGLVPTNIQFSPNPSTYNRSNFTYEFRLGTWSELTEDFVNNLGPAYIRLGYNVLSYQFSYLNVADYENIASPTNGFFANNSTAYDIYDLEAFWARNPNRIYILWTTSLARSIGTQVAQDFNNQMRSYAEQHNMWLFDVAAIESYTASGAACYDNRDGVSYCSRRSDGTIISCENYPNDRLSLPAICQDYTTEIDGGHLGSVSGADIRLAKAFWVLMARVAGWDGVSQ